MRKQNILSASVVPFQSLPSILVFYYSVTDKLSDFKQYEFIISVFRGWDSGHGITRSSAHVSQGDNQGVSQDLVLI